MEWSLTVRLPSDGETHAAGRGVRVVRRSQLPSRSERRARLDLHAPPALLPRLATEPREVVDRDVTDSIRQFEIRRPVVQLVPVPVVDDLRGQERATQDRLHDVSVLADALPSNGDDSIAVGSNRASAVRGALERPQRIAGTLPPGPVHRAPTPGVVGLATTPDAALAGRSRASHVNHGSYRRPGDSARTAGGATCPSR